MAESAADAANVLNLERFLPYRLSLLSNTVSRAIAKIYADRFGLTIAEWRVVAVVARYDRPTQNDVGLRTAMDKVRVSRSVSALVRRGLVRRRADTADRRRQTLELSPRGWSVYRAVAPLAVAHETKLLQALAAEDRLLLDRLLATLQSAAEGL
jgi:DNA-binding MarR family transcriptional regulator